jgi:DUF1680 family protein
MQPSTPFKFSGLIVAFVLFTSITNVKDQTSAQDHGDYPIQPVLFTAVKFNDQFWAPRIKINHDVTIPFTLAQCKETGRVRNFEIAAGLKTGDFCTVFTFDDTDLYKIIEGACYAFQISDDPILEAKVDSLITLIGQAQEPDGYLYTNRTIMGDRAHEWAGKSRWEKESELSHELYNIGHLIEAAVAHYYATGKRNFLDIAVKAADRVCYDFGPDKLHIYPGHQIIELAMAKLYRVTGDKKYLDMGKFLLDVRGPGGNPYNQAHKKVVDQHEAVGHAVRATYMYAGMADIAALTKDESYIKAIDDIWEDVVSKKIYVTGGIGATGDGEAFGKPYELPNMSAYNETCASIANIYWNYRLFLLHGDAKYYDVLERTLYNAFLSGVSLTGDRFFYPNPLESHGQHSRSAWFSCACCPGNVARFIPSVGGYFYAQKDQSIFINLFAQGSASFNLAGEKIMVEQKTNYPWDGDILINVLPEKTSSFDVRVRIPGWAVNKPIPSDLYTFADQVHAQPKVFLNDKPVKLVLQQGYVVFNRKWKKGDHIRIQLPMTIRKMEAHEQVVDDRNKFAVERGPLVYCAEWPDNNQHVINLVADEKAPLTGSFQSDVLHGIYIVKGAAQSTARTSEKAVATNNTTLTLIPYYAWAHRGAGEMMVWIPDNVSATKPLPLPTLASRAKISASYPQQTLRALNDQVEPAHSNDHSVIYYHWWPRKDTTEWLEYDFEKPVSISSSKVYWYDDGPEGGCRIPAGWRLLFKQGDTWVPVKNKTTYEVVKDKYSTVTFDAVTTSALRMEVVLPSQFSSGVMEWVVE